jgi:hypothetical protein
MTQRCLKLPWRILVGAVFMIAVSCSGKTPVYRVTGKVMIDGEPAVGAIVTFHAAEGSNSNFPAPHGFAGPDGVFKVTTFKTNDGAPAGKYGVTIYWAKRLSSDDFEVLSPPRYSDPSTSGLTVVVEKRSNELPPFELTKN